MNLHDIYPGFTIQPDTKDFLTIPEYGDTASAPTLKIENIKQLNADLHETVSRALTLNESAGGHLFRPCG